MSDSELLEAFISEAYELLDEIEPQLIELSQSSDASKVDSETLNAIFRLFHTLKSGAGIVGLDTFSAITHDAETLLDIFRNGKAVLKVDHTLTLCETIDFLRILLSTISDAGSDQGHDREAGIVTDKLQAAIIDCGGKAIKPADKISSSEAPPISIDLGEEGGPDKDSAGKNMPDQNTEPLRVEITPAMRQSYAQEAEDFLDQAEESIMSIKNTSADETLQGLEAAFRALHSLKGNSGFMGFPDVERLAHKMENALQTMREETDHADQNNISMLLKLFDVLRKTVTRIADGDSGEIQAIDVYMELLDDIAPASGQAAGGQAEKPEPLPDAADSAEQVPHSLDKSLSTARQIQQNIRVDIKKLDSLINLVGELVIAEAMVTRHPHVASTEIESLERAIHLLRRVSRDLQDVSMSIRMIPLAGTFRRMIRLVHDLGNKFNKNISLKLLGEDTEVDKTVIEHIADPLVHIIRNAADHGIETPQERLSAGKPEKAHITIEGRHEGGEVWILIRDDGRGLDRERILFKARENGLVGDEADEWPDSRVFRLIFEPGFSTADNVTDVSGRGVGMDVVRKNLEKLKGKADIRSIPGKGSTVILRIPLTLAIIDGMLVRVGEARYTIPMLTIRESFRPDPSWITVTPDGQENVRIREDFYPVLRLHERFNKEPDCERFEDGILILVEGDGQMIALFVDEILGQQETVIKGISGFLGDLKGISGCTILGDGEVSLILDIAGLVDEQEHDSVMPGIRQ